MPGPYYFAWCDEADGWGPSLEVEDEDIFELEISQSEGAFAQLTLDVHRPDMGLLAPGRKQWCWVAWFDGFSVQPLFHGRVLGAPENIVGEIWRFVFLAKPSDYTDRKATLGDTLRVLPYWDPVWLAEKVDDPDTVLETRTALWHTDRTTLELTISDLIEGEDGQIDVSAEEHFYDGVDVSYGQTPLRRINVKATLPWTQQATGEVDLTARLVAAFQAAGSPFGYPMVSSYTADGLLGDWPKPLANLSGGWSIPADASAVVASYIEPIQYAVRYVDKTDNKSIAGVAERDALGNPAPGETPRLFFINWKNYDVVFTCQPLLIDFRVAYEASRKRSEIVTFTVSAATQSILTEPEGADEETIELTSTFVDQPVDPEGAVPIGDPRRNVYLPTERGQLSLQFLMLLARARLAARARAVNITFQFTWEKLAAQISCRKSVLIHDYRLPGGQASGKVISYRMTASDKGDNLVEVTIGCSIGYGVELPEAAAGEDVYATGYSTGYTARTGAEVAVIDRVLHYESMAGAYVIDDDGVDLSNMTPNTVVQALSIADGPISQRIVIEGALRNPGSYPDVELGITADVADGGASISNMSSVEGLLAGAAYRIDGPGVTRLHGTISPLLGEDEATRFIFDGASGGTVNPPAQVVIPGLESKDGKHTRGFRISSLSSADLGIVPDPVGALGDHPTIVTLDLVPVTGGEFQTEFAVNVLDLVVPQGIDLEAA